jgi:hypothetical protein
VWLRLAAVQWNDSEYHKIKTLWLICILTDAGLNLKSEVNLLNVTTFEETPVELQFQDEPDGLLLLLLSPLYFCHCTFVLFLYISIMPTGSGPPIDFNFYKNFWSLQSYFQNPAALTNVRPCIIEQKLFFFFSFMVPPPI